MECPFMTFARNWKATSTLLFRTAQLQLQVQIRSNT